MGVIFFSVGVAGCDIFLGVCGWLWVGVIFSGWVWVGVIFFWVGEGGRDIFLGGCG